MYVYVAGCCGCPSMSCGTLTNTFAGPRELWRSALLPTENGSADWQGPGFQCLGLAGCVSCLAPQCWPLPGIWAAWAQPFPPSLLTSGCVGGLVWGLFGGLASG